MKSKSLRFGVVAFLMAATALLLQARPGTETLPPRQPLSAMPSQFGAWVGEDLSIDPQTLDILGAGEFLHRNFENPEKPFWIDLFIAYFPSQKAGDTIHSPNHCLQGSGWVPVRRDIVYLSRPDGTTFPANRFVTSKEGERQLVIYWYLAHGRAIASEYSSKYYLIADAIRLNRSDGALVRLITPMHRKESPEEAQARLVNNIGQQLIPILNDYIPR